AALLGLPYVVVAVNKMDLVSYDRQVFEAIEQNFRRFLAGFRSIEPFFIPISALQGDNVVSHSSNTPWYLGPTLLEYLEEVPVSNRAHQAPFRFFVQRVVRPDLDFRGYAGTIAAGSVSLGDAITVFPSRRQSIVSGITTFDGPLDRAAAGQAVTLTLADDLDITRGN